MHYICNIYVCVRVYMCVCICSLTCVCIYFWVGIPLRNFNETQFGIEDSRELLAFYQESLNKVNSDNRMWKQTTWCTSGACIRHTDSLSRLLVCFYFLRGEQKEDMLCKNFIPFILLCPPTNKKHFFSKLNFKELLLNILSITV